MKKLITQKILSNIINELNKSMNPIDLCVENSFEHHNDIDRENIPLGNYFPADTYTLPIYWTQHYIDENKNKQIYKHKVGLIIFDQFYSILRLNLPEEYDSNIDFVGRHLTNDMVVEKFEEFVPRTLVYYMYKEYGGQYLTEMLKYLSVLYNLNDLGITPPHFTERAFMLDWLEHVIKQIVQTKQFNPQSLHEVELYDLTADMFVDDPLLLEENLGK